MANLNTRVKALEAQACSESANIPFVLVRLGETDHEACQRAGIVRDGSTRFILVRFVTPAARAGDDDDA